MDRAPEENWAQAIEKAAAIVQDLKSLETGYEGWEELGTIKEVEGMRLRCDSGLYVVRAAGLVPAEPEAVLSLVMDLDRKKSWDPMFVEGRVVKELSPELKINYQHFYAPWPVSHRDFVFLSVVKREEDGTIVYGGTSIELPSIPEMSGLVRGQMVRGGFVIRRFDQNVSKVTYLVNVDPKGMLPTMIVNKFQQSQTANVYKIRKVFLQKT